jgi:SNF2 family DNA or RNA helicase
MRLNLLVMDEGHKLQSPGSRVSKFFHQLGKTVQKRVALTGTPCPNGPLTIYGLYRALDSGIFGTSFAKFRDEFAIMGGYGQHEVIGYKNIEEYNRRFYSIAIHADRSVLSLPPAVTVQRTAALSPSALKIYKSLEKDLVAQIENGTVTAANGLVKLLRLSQLTGGWLTPDVDVFNPEARSQRIDTAKQELLADVLDDLPKEEPVVVFFRFTADSESIKAVCHEQGRTYSELSGQKNQLKDWQNNGQVLAVQIATGGLGVDLTRSCYCLYYSVG